MFTVKKKQETRINFDNCITDFLGQEICESPVVRNSKLTADEREALDMPLSIGELDESLNNCNLKSAAGSDGFSNKLIKLCWQHLRIPLFNYANFCFTTGLMTHNFRSASIKLIPKKGDLGNLKNWRPICRNFGILFPQTLFLAFSEIQFEQVLGNKIRELVAWVESICPDPL
jgi:hypothetical protein